MRISNPIRFALFILLLLYIGYHGWTLPLYPFPWFDEVYYASITESLLKEGSLIPEIASVARHNKEALTYGPVYFLLTGLSFSVSGFGIVPFRIVAWVSGWLVILVTWQIMRTNNTGKYIAGITALIFCLDPFFLYNMHRGRMETTGLLWMILALFILLRILYNKDQRGYMFSLAGGFIVTGLLTTPRTGILLAGMTPLLWHAFYALPAKMRWKRFFLWLTPIMVGYGTWVLIAFGSVSGFIQYYLKIAGGNETAHAGYLGGNFYIPPHEYVLIGASILAVFFLLVRDPGKLKRPLPLSCLLTLLLYYIFVKDWGPYSVLIIPCYYLLIAQALSAQTNIKWRLHPLAYGIALLLCFNVTYQAGKGIQVISSLQERDPARLYRFTKQHLPEEAKVVGPPSLYYAARKANCRYQLYNKYNTLENRERLHRTKYNYDYLITSRASQSRDKNVLEYYQNKADLIKKAGLKPIKRSGNFLVDKIPFHQETGYYNAIIYKRKKTNQEAN